MVYLGFQRVLEKSDVSPQARELKRVAQEDSSRRHAHVRARVIGVNVPYLAGRAMECE